MSICWPESWVDSFNTSTFILCQLKFRKKWSSIFFSFISEWRNSVPLWSATYFNIPALCYLQWYKHKNYLNTMLQMKYPNDNIIGYQYYFGDDFYVSLHILQTINWSVGVGIGSRWKSDMGWCDRCCLLTVPSPGHFMMVSRKTAVQSDFNGCFVFSTNTKKTKIKPVFKSNKQ